MLVRQKQNCMHRRSMWSFSENSNSSIWPSHTIARVLTQRIQHPHISDLLTHPCFLVYCAIPCWLTHCVPSFLPWRRKAPTSAFIFHESFSASLKAFPPSYSFSPITTFFSLCFFFLDFYFLISMSALSTHTPASQKRASELITGGCEPLWLLGTEHRTCGRQDSALNCGAILTVPTRPSLRTVFIMFLNNIGVCSSHVLPAVAHSLALRLLCNLKPAASAVKGLGLLFLDFSMQMWTGVLSAYRWFCFCWFFLFCLFFHKNGI